MGGRSVDHPLVVVDGGPPKLRRTTGQGGGLDTGDYGNPSHGTDPNDAILAATVQETGDKLFALNVEHFSMPDLMLQKAW